MIINSPLNYTGNKFDLLPQILPLFDYSKSNFIDLFVGGGSVYVNVLDKYKTIIINDIIVDLVDIHKNLTDAEFIESVKSFCVNKEDSNGYNNLRNSYNENKSAAKLYALMLCCTNNMIRFNKKFLFNQTFGKRTFNSKTEEKIKAFVEHRLNFNNLYFSSVHFSNFSILPDSFYYIDPPYSNTGAGYNVFWENDDDYKLFDYCKRINQIGSTFAVSGTRLHNNKTCELIELLKAEGFKVHLLDKNYKKVAKKADNSTQEVLITNY